MKTESVRSKISGFKLKKAKGVIGAFLVYLVLTIIWAVASYVMNLRYELIDVGGYIVMLVSLVVASVWTAYLCDGKGWLNGILGGLALLLLIFLLGLIFNGAQCDVMRFVIRLPIFAVISLIGGIIGINMK